MMDHIDCLFSRDGLPSFFSGSLSDIADAGQHAPRKRVWDEACCQILDDSSALHEWPATAKRARNNDGHHDGRRDGHHDAWEHSGSLDCHAFPQKNATPSMSVPSSFCPARPRANAMHIFDEGGVAAGDVVPPLRDTSQRESTSPFVRFAQLASHHGITPLHLPAPDKFPTTMQMETIVRAIVAT